MPNDLIVTKRRGLSWYISWIVLVIILLVIAFFWGRYDSRDERLALIEERDILLLQEQEYLQQIDSLEQKNIMLQSSAQVDASASEEIMDTIATLQQTIDSLETELSFYRGIMAPEKDIKGLYVSDFNLKKTTDADRFAFQLALTQVKKHDVFLKGNVKVIISGERDGKTVNYNITDLSNISANDLEFTFKYFQHLKGELTLPNGFKPKKINVTAKSTGRNGQTVTRDFNWSV